MRAALMLFLMANSVYAVSFLSEKRDELEQQRESSGKTKRQKSSKQNDSVSHKQSSTIKLSDEEFQNQLNKRTDVFGEKVTKTLDAYYSGPIILEGTQKVRTLDQFDGVIKDSFLTTQTPEELIVYANDPTGPLYNSKLRCVGSVFVQRVKIACDLLITPTKEYHVKVLIREKFDGVSTLLPDKFYTGEEARMIKVGGATFLGGLIDTGKERAMTDNGEQEVINMKNKILNGAFDVAQMPLDSLKRSANSEPIVAVVNSGREVRIEFLEGVKGEL